MASEAALDRFVHFVYDSIVEVSKWLSLLQPLILLQYPFSRELAIASNSINGTMAVYASLAGQRLYWLHELVLVIICTFGGGFMAPILLGRPAMVLNNDLIVFFCTVAWYLIFYLKGNVWLNYPPVKAIWLTFVGLFRTLVVPNIVTIAHTVLQPSAYYPIPLFGPIIAGAVLGSAGSFFPFDKGLIAIKNGTPWQMQAAFYTAVFYQFMIMDTKGFIGNAFRMVFGNLSRTTVLTIIAASHIVHLQMHYFLSPDANLYTPIHKLAYMVFGLNGPIVTQKPATASVGWDKVARNRVHHLIGISRVLTVIGFVVAYVSVMVPMTHITTVTLPSMKFSRSNRIDSVFEVKLTENEYGEFAAQSLLLNHPVGGCQFLSAFRSCTPYQMRLEEIVCDNPSNLNSKVCQTDDKSIIQLAVYQSNQAKYQSISNGFSNVAPVEFIKLLASESFTQHPTYLESKKNSTISSLPLSLAVSSDGQVIVYQAFKSASSVSVLYSNTAHVVLSRQKDSAVCGEISEKAVMQDADLTAFRKHAIEQIGVSHVDGKIIAYCGNNRLKEEL